MPKRRDSATGTSMAPTVREAPARDVHVQHVAVVHLVDVVAGEHDRPARLLPLDRIEVLVDGVGGAEVPVLPDALLRRQDLDELAELGIHDAPAHADVAVQALGLVLRHDEDLAQARVDAVREREVDDAIGSAERHRRLGPVAGQREEALPGAAGEEDGHDVTEQQDVHGTPGSSRVSSPRQRGPAPARARRRRPRCAAAGRSCRIRRARRRTGRGLRRSRRPPGAARGARRSRCCPNFSIDR